MQLYLSATILRTYNLMIRPMYLHTIVRAYSLMSYIHTIRHFPIFTPCRTATYPFFWEPTNFQIPLLSDIAIRFFRCYETTLFAPVGVEHTFFGPGAPCRVSAILQDACRPTNLACRALILQTPHRPGNEM